MFIVQRRSHQSGARGHQVARKERTVHPRVCSENNIKMINGFTLTNINSKIIKEKLSENFISEVRIKLVVLRINRYTKSEGMYSTTTTLLEWQFSVWQLSWLAVFQVFVVLVAVALGESCPSWQLSG